MGIRERRLTRRGGWTEEENAVGHVLVKGDGSMTSQSAMEVEGESVGDKGSHRDVDSSVINSEVKKRKGKKGKGSVKKRMFGR